MIPDRQPSGPQPRGQRDVHARRTVRTRTARRGAAPSAVVAAAVFVALLLLAVLASQTAAWSQVNEQPDPTSVAVVPATSHPDDPHHGTWFVMTLLPGESGQQVATIVNPTNAPRTVDLSIRHVEFDDGELRLAEDPTAGVASWGSFEQPRVTVPPRDRVQVPFTLTVPQSGVEPRDYVGAAVASTSSPAGNATVVQQVATRIYVTVPGETAHRFEVADVRSELDSAWWPRSVLVTVTVRNTGAIRIAPTVKIAGQEARGPRFILSGTDEQYVVDLAAPLVANSVSLPVDVSDDTGAVRRVNASTMVVRWGFLVGLIVVLIAGGLTTRWWRRHESRYAQLERDMRRLERLVASMKRPDGVAAPATTVEAGSAPAADTFTAAVGDDPTDAEHKFHAALKRARRTGDEEAIAQLALARHAARHPDALPLLLEALKRRSSQHAGLATAAASYGPEALEEAMSSAGLGDSTRRMLYGLARADQVVLTESAEEQPVDV